MGTNDTLHDLMDKLGRLVFKYEKQGGPEELVKQINELEQKIIEKYGDEENERAYVATRLNQ